MNRRAWPMALCAVLLIATGACTKKSPAPELVVEIPAGYSGNFSLEMGVKDAPPLLRQGDSYVVAVPRSGKLTTSTLLTNAAPTFKNSGGSAVWGYSHSVLNTGDGIPIGGKIEFFVGTRKEYEAEEGKKNHSRGFPAARESTRAGA